MKILRLSLFNLKKNKKEAIGIVLLTMISAFMIGLFVSNISKISNAFDKSFEESGSKDTFVLFSEKEYRDVYREILEEQYQVKDPVQGKYLYAFNTTVLRGEEKIGYSLVFFNEENEKKLEDFEKIDSLPEEEINALEHPIWLPSNFKYSLGYKTGEAFTIESGGMQIPFVIAGFYNSGLYNHSGYGFKLIVSKEDYKTLMGISVQNIFLTFDNDNDISIRDYLNACRNESGESIQDSDWISSYNAKDAECQFLNLFLYISICTSLITFIASIYMIRNKISNDIEDQMQQIGVLEALGYKGGEISLSYVFEYVISAGIGTILGSVTALLITPLSDNVIRVMLGREAVPDNGFILAFPAAFLTLVVIILFALLKAREVKKYPPVVAFRRGIRTHHFKRNVLPMDKLKGNVNMRIALKESLRNIKSQLGIGICIILSGTTMLFGMFTFDFFKNGADGFIRISGMEIPEILINLNPGVDAYQIAEELETLPEVRKAMATYDLGWVNVKDSDRMGSPVVMDDYKEAENIFPSEGRYPVHDNEIMISLMRSKNENLGVDDSIVIENNGIEESYIITGIVGNMTQSCMCLYFTTDGYMRINGGRNPDSINIYLEDGVDRIAFEDKLLSIYGTSVDDAFSDKKTGESLEEKLSAEAKEKIAALMSRYGVTSVDYAVQIGDKVYTGNSRQFVIKKLMDFRNLLKSQMGQIADISKIFSLLIVLVVAFIVAVILGIISLSGVKRRSRELGIMKGLGYTSKDLMTQVAMGIIPVTIISLIIASVCGVIINKLFWQILFGVVMNTNVPILIITDVVMILFCYIVTYIGAGRIRKISVNELITE